MRHKNKALKRVVLEAWFQFLLRACRVASIYSPVASNVKSSEHICTSTRFSCPSWDLTVREVWGFPRWRDRAGHNREPATCLRPASRMRLQSHGTPGSSVRSSLATRSGRFSLAPLDRPSGLRRLSFSLPPFPPSLPLSVFLSLLLSDVNVEAPHRIRASTWFSNSSTCFFANMHRGPQDLSREIGDRKSWKADDARSDAEAKGAKISKQTIAISIDVVDPRRGTAREVRYDRFWSDASVIESCYRFEWTRRLQEMVRRMSRDTAAIRR